MRSRTYGDRTKLMEAMKKRVAVVGDSEAQPDPVLPSCMRCTGRSEPATGRAFHPAPFS